MKARGIVLVAGLMALAGPASARVLKTRSTASETWAPLSAFVIGSGFEYHRDSEQAEYDFPILIEYNVSERLKLIVEPDFSRIVGRTPDVRSVSGLGDLETSVEYEFLRERRYRPALSMQALVKWPTASDPDLGTAGRDYSIGLIASKDLVLVDVDANVRYTFTGDREERDTVELSVSAEWHLNHRLDVLAEALTTIPIGRGGRTESEGTLGLGWRVNSNLKIEQGAIYRSDHTWQFVFAWEWSFGGD